MIDLRELREHPDRFRASQRARGEDPGLVDEAFTADERWRAATAQFESLRARQKAAGRLVAQAPEDRRPAMVAEARQLADDVRSAETAANRLAEKARAAAYLLSNLVEVGAPQGGEDDAVPMATAGSPPRFDFTPRDHVELGALLGVIDVERGAKVSGTRFYFLTGMGALLELALVNLAVEQAVAAGFTPVIPPALVRPEAMAGTGFLGAHASEVYRLADDDLYLVGTAEVPLAAFHTDEILDPATLPRRYVGYSPCFRREAGSHGKDTRGIIRVHWFDKVEMFTFCDPADAHAEHLRLLGWQRQFLDLLELPYRVVDIAAGDLGSSAVRKYDCEAWIPTQGRYREVTSTSNCTTFQARRLAVRMRTGTGTSPVATLNGTLCAIARTLVALLEVNQRADGSVRLPVALADRLGREVIEPPK